MKIMPEMEREAEDMGLDLDTELESPTFRALIRAGVPLKAAYTALHTEEMCEKARIEAEKTAAAKYGRVRELGSSDFAAPQSRNGLTAADRADIARRVANGEKIKL